MLNLVGLDQGDEFSHGGPFKILRRDSFIGQDDDRP
jgi:hypothetical protein